MNFLFAHLLADLIAVRLFWWCRNLSMNSDEMCWMRLRRNYLALKALETSVRVVSINDHAVALIIDHEQESRVYI